MGQTDSLWKGSVFAASVFKQRTHSSCNLECVYLKCDTVDTYDGQSVAFLGPHLRGRVVARVLANRGGLLEGLCDQTTHLGLAHVRPPLSIQQSVRAGMRICVCWAKGTLMESNVCVILESPK